MSVPIKSQEEWSFFHMKVRKYSIEVEVDDIFPLRERHFSSPVFHDQKTQWYFEVSIDSAFSVDVFVCLHDSIEEFACFSLEFGLKTVKNEVLLRKKSHIPTWLRRGALRGLKNFFSLNEITQLQKEVFEDGAAVFFCEIREIMTNECLLNPFFARLEKLFDLGNFSDAVVCVSDCKFQVHKAILALGSPVFAAMFETNMLEQKENKVEITDCDAEVVKEMLQFIYTGKSPNVAKMAKDLLPLADKYDIKALVEICSKALMSTVAVTTACEIITLAEVHCLKDLKDTMIKFINQNALEVSKSAGWLEMVRSHPELFTQLYVDSISNK